MSTLAPPAELPASSRMACPSPADISSSTRRFHTSSAWLAMRSSAMSISRVKVEPERPPTPMTATRRPMRVASRAAMAPSRRVVS